MRLEKILPMHQYQSTTCLFCKSKPVQPMLLVEPPQHNTKSDQLTATPSALKNNIKKSSRFVTSFMYNNSRFILNRLPFGISLAPFVCQKFVNAIVQDIKSTTEHVWAHIDDILVAHHDPKVLTELAELLIRKFTLVDWKLNMKKSIIKPSTSLTFLGAIWSQTKVKRSSRETAPSLASHSF